MSPEKHEYIWRCDCGGGHFLSLEWDSGGNWADFEGYLHVEGDFTTSWRQRVAQAWRVLRGGCSTTRVGLILRDPEALELMDALADFGSYSRAAEAVAAQDRAAGSTAGELPGPAADAGGEGGTAAGDVAP